MTLKEEDDYFEVDISPYEQYRKMILQEKVQRASEVSRGMYKYIPAPAFPEDRKDLVHKIFTLGRNVNQSALTMHLAVKLLDRVFSSCYNADLGES